MKYKKSDLALIGLAIALMAFLTVDHLVKRHIINEVITIYGQ